MRKLDVPAKFAALLLFIGLFQPMVGFNFMGQSVSSGFTYLDAGTALVTGDVFKVKEITKSNIVLFLFVITTVTYFAAFGMLLLFLIGGSRSWQAYRTAHYLTWIAVGSGIAFPHFLLRAQGATAAAAAGLFGAGFVPGLAVYIAGFAALVLAFGPSYA